MQGFTWFYTLEYIALLASLADTMSNLFPTKQPEIIPIPPTNPL